MENAGTWIWIGIFSAVIGIPLLHGFLVGLFGPAQQELTMGQKVDVEIERTRENAYSDGFNDGCAARY